jgi:hypothetical protein
MVKKEHQRNWTSKLTDAVIDFIVWGYEIAP